MKNEVPIRSVSRFIDVLKEINADGPLTLGEIVQSTGIPYPTTSRIVQTLLSHGLIAQVPRTKTYCTAAMAMTLSAGFQTPQRVAAIAKPVIEAMTREVGWPVTVTTRVGMDMVVQASTHHLTSLTLKDCPTGVSIPVLHSASGHVFLAFADPDEQRCVLDGMRRCQKVTPMLAMFLDGRPQARIRADGYATFERNQYARDPNKTSAISLPLFERGRFVGVLSLVFFTSAMPLADALQRYLASLQAAATTIEALLDRSVATPGRADAPQVAPVRPAPRPRLVQPMRPPAMPQPEQTGLRMRPRNADHDGLSRTAAR